MRLTLRGRTLAILSAGFLLFGRLVAVQEFSMVGISLAVITGIGAVAVWTRSGTVEVRRRIFPARTHAGQDVRVDLEVRCRGPVGGGPVLLGDRLPEVLGGAVRTTLGAGSSRLRGRKVSYVIGPRIRGRYEIGPLEITHTDPFGAVSRRQEASGTADLIVYPSFEPITTMPIGVQRLGVIRHSPLLGSGDEFYALRPYAEGDDPRKVHWPSSAKRGQILVRQEELLGEPRALIILDTCANKHRGTGEDASLEAAISACASVATLAVANRMRLDVVTSDGPLLRTRRPRTDDVLEALALLEPSENADLTSALKGVDPRWTGGPVSAVVITPGIDKAETGILSTLVAAAPGGAVVLVAADTFDEAERWRRKEPSVALGRPVVVLRHGESFRDAWEGGVRGVALAR